MIEEKSKELINETFEEIETNENEINYLKKKEKNLF